MHPLSAGLVLDDLEKLFTETYQRPQDTRWRECRTRQLFLARGVLTALIGRMHACLGGSTSGSLSLFETAKMLFNRFVKLSFLIVHHD